MIPRYKLRRVWLTCLIGFLILLAIFLSTNCASSQTGRALNVSVVGAGIADYTSTQIALQRGGTREANAVMGGTAIQQAVVKSVGIGGIIALAHLVEQRDHPRLAHVLRAAAIVGWSAISLWNVQVGR